MSNYFFSNASTTLLCCCCFKEGLPGCSFWGKRPRQCIHISIHVHVPNAKSVAKPGCDYEFMNLIWVSQLCFHKPHTEQVY